MSDLERIWSEKSDDVLLEAAASLGDFTDEGREVVLAELRRRGLDVPEQTGDPGDETTEEGEAEAEVEGLTCLRCGVVLQHLGTRDLGSLGEFGRMFEGKELLEVYNCPGCGHVDLFTNVAEEPAVEGEDGER
jgi:hypothetical protein